MDNMKDSKAVDMVKALDKVRKNPRERERLNREWERMTARESKKGPAGDMVALFMKAVRF